jgi:alpha-glucosidase/alpha-D-xyloside xylohydrolase
LPWGWGLKELGPLEGNHYPLLSELNNPAIEPIARKYNELRYQLLPYTYSLTWEAHHEGMPLMRALWLHYPNDLQARPVGNEYLWGRDLLIAPVFKKGAAIRDVYLPEGNWYDWWTLERKVGGRNITRSVNLETMPIYVRAGAIIPIDPIRQYTDEVTHEPTTLKIFSGANGDYTLYEDDGISQKYLQGDAVWIHITWNDKANKLTVEPGEHSKRSQSLNRNFRVELIPGGKIKEIKYEGRKIEVSIL